MSDSTASATEPFSCARRQLLLASAGAGGVALLAACGSSSKSSSATATNGPTSAGASSAGSASASAGSGGTTVKGIIALADVPSNTSVSVKDSTGRILLITQSGGKLTALDATCTHMACTVAPAGSVLQCPCHGSQYQLTGAVIQGPAPTALHNVAVKVTSGQVVLA